MMACIIGRQCDTGQLCLIPQLPDKERAENGNHRTQAVFHLLLSFLLRLSADSPIGKPEKSKAGHRLNNPHIQIIAQRCPHAHCQQIQYNRGKPCTGQNMGDFVSACHSHQQKLRLISHFCNKNRCKHCQKNNHLCPHPFSDRIHSPYPCITIFFRHSFCSVQKTHVPMKQKR